ncbi:MAG: SAM-dependent methyltransferase [Erysipelotrichaceae bacterium]|nr:SAM-dependent methyltransferase [Erysipelotrichaceae bacterium]
MTNIKLSKRLKIIAECIDRCDVMYDVGTDHAYLPCYAVAEGLAKKAYAGDNKPGPLQNAKENIQQLQLEGRVIPLLADGIGETPELIDTVVISGLGPDTALQIMNDSLGRGIKRWIIQVNKGSEQIRSFLSEHHFTILNERCVRDGYYYQIIVFSQEEHAPYSEEEILLGPVLMKNREADYIDYVQDTVRRYRILKERGSERVERPLAIFEEYLSSIHADQQEQ